METNFSRIFVVLGLCAAAGLIASASALAADYTISKITENTYMDIDPKISDGGDIIWLGNPIGNRYTLFLYDGNSTTQLAYNVLQAGQSHNINEDGQVVWPESIGTDTEIMFYDGSTNTRLTENSYGDFGCDINDIGEIVWYGPQSSDGEIFLYDGNNTTQLTTNSYEDGHPHINTSGHVVWIARPEDAGFESEIMFYDGNSTIRLTNDSYFDNAPMINDSDQIVWYGGDGVDSEIFFYDENGVTQLTNNSYDDESPRINNNGYVVWTGFDGLDNEIFLWDGNDITQITNNNYNDENPVINDSGHVAWKGQPTGYNGEIFVYDGNSITQLTDNSYWKSSIDINALGQIVWYASDGDDREIYLATPSGPPLIRPIADAGIDQVVFDACPLDGSGSNDSDGTIESYNWQLQHRENPDYNTSAQGENPTVSGLEPGFYDVTLTVADNDGLTDSDTMLLAASGACEGRPSPNVEMSINKMEVDLKEGKFEIEGYLGITNPYDLVLNPQSRLLLELQTNPAESDAEFGVVAEDQVQLTTDDDWEELRYEE